MDALETLAQEPLDPQSDVPLYQQLEDRILQLIATGAFANDAPLPTEVSICEALGLSRSTVRRCFESLVQNGHVVRRRGRGTFVAESQGADGYMGSINFAEEMRALGRMASVRILGFREVAASGLLVEWLQVPAGTAVWESRRVRLADGVPVQLDITFFPRSVCPDLVEADLYGSLYQKIAQASGKLPARRTEVYEAICLDKAESGALERPVGSPALKRNAVSYDASGAPYEACICIEPGAAAQLVVDMNSTTARVGRRYL